MHRCTYKEREEDKKGKIQRKSCKRRKNRDIGTKPISWHGNMERKKYYLGIDTGAERAGTSVPGMRLRTLCFC